MRALALTDLATLGGVKQVSVFDVGASTSGWDGSAWTPTSGWATATGTSNGQPRMRRASGLSTHVGYLEFEMWQTGTSADNWVGFALGWGTSTTSSDDGYFWVVRSPSSTVVPNQIVGAYGSGTTYTLPAAPNSEANKVTIGLEVTGPKTTTVYVNRVPRCSMTHTTDHSAKRNVMFCVDNGAVGRIRNVAVYDRRP